MDKILDGYSNDFSYKVKKWKEVKKGFTHFKKGDIGVAKITLCFENRKSVIFDKLKNGFGARTTELHIIRVNDSVIKFQEFLRLSIKSHFVYIASNNKAQA